MSGISDKNLINIYSDHMQILLTPKTNIKIKDDCNEEKKPDEVIGKSKIIAILLAIFLGRFGIHKFYLGKPAFGLLYLLFSRFEFIMFLSLCDVIFYLFMDEEHWLKEYGSKKFEKKKR